MRRIYIAGPYSQGNVEDNVERAIDAAESLSNYGFAPYVPHLTHFWELRHRHPYEFWLALDNAFLPTCDALLRLPGQSDGADKEVRLAELLGIPVFYSIDTLRDALS